MSEKALIEAEKAALDVVIHYDRLEENGETETIRRLAAERYVGASSVLDAIRELRKPHCIVIKINDRFVVCDCEICSTPNPREE